jgi:uncharacterized protein (DUF2147 family)
VTAPPNSRPTLTLLSLVLAVLFGPGIVLAQPPGPSLDPTGEWLVEKKIARIKIADCDNKMWGVVSWEAKPGVDSKNPDPTLRTRPTLGMPILLSMTPSTYNQNQWDGKIYNSEDGHTYSASIKLLNPDTLRVEGCFLGFLCGGENWSRFVPESPPDARAPPPKNSPPPKNAQARPGQPNGRKTAATPPQTEADDVCSRLAGTPGFTH